MEGRKSDREVGLDKRESMCLCVCVALRSGLNDCLIVFQKQHSGFHYQFNTLLHTQCNSEGQLSALHTYYTLEMLNFVSVIPRMNHLFCQSTAHTHTHRLTGMQAVFCQRLFIKNKFSLFSVLFGINGEEGNARLSEELSVLIFVFITLLRT